MDRRGGDTDSYPVGFWAGGVQSEPGKHVDLKNGGGRVPFQNGADGAQLGAPRWAGPSHVVPWPCVLVTFANAIDCALVFLNRATKIT